MPSSALQLPAATFELRGRAVSQDQDPWTFFGDGYIDEQPPSQAIGMSDWRPQVLRELLRRAFEASEPDWDGNGSAAVESSTLRYSGSFLSKLPLEVQPPEIEIDADGEIAFEWHQDRRHNFTVSVGRDGTLTYSGLFGVRGAYGYEQLVDHIPETILTNLARACVHVAR